MKNSAHHIPGIYNYCDRWCERCHFTSRCAVFENTGDIPPEERDIHNKAFWDRLRDNFKEAIELLHKAAEKQRIDIDNLSPETEDAYEQRKTIHRLAKEHALATWSMQYAENAGRWLQNRNALEEKGGELLRNLELGIANEKQTGETLGGIKDCLEVIQWYLYFIHIKFSRAVSGKMVDDGSEEEHGFQKDSDGSAMIAVRRSMQAWVELFRILPQEEDHILPLLAHLQKIDQLAEREFPDAEKFIRPGFDE